MNPLQLTWSFSSKYGGSRRNPWKRLLANLRSSGKALRVTGGRAKRPILITAVDLEEQFDRQDSRCYWLGIKLNPEDVYRTGYVLTPSIDRLDNDGDYTPTNFVICARFANLGRGSLPPAEFAVQVKQMRKMIYGDLWPKFQFDGP